MIIVLSYIIANLALSLYIAYRKPTHAWVDAPAFFVVLSAFVTIPAMVVEAWKAVKR